MKAEYAYNATVVSVQDGDTVTLDVDLGFSMIAHTQKFRLYGPDPLGKLGLNAPEIATPAGKTSRDVLSAMLPVGLRVEIVTVKDRKEKYGRYLAVIYLKPSGFNVNAHLVTSGNAALKEY